MAAGPLEGFTIGVTAAGRGLEQAGYLERRGAQVLLAPAVHLATIEQEDALHEQTAHAIALRPRTAIFTTALGLRTWFEAAATAGRDRALRNVLADATIWCRGRKTLGAATALGLDVDWVAETSAALAARLGDPDGEAPILIQVDGYGSPDLVTAARAGRERVVAIATYGYAPPENLEPMRRLVAGVVDGQVDAVTFTSRPAVQFFSEAAASLGLAQSLGAAFNDRCVPVCVGASSTKEATSAGFGEPLVPERPLLGSMIQTISAYFGSRSRRFDALGASVLVQGRLLIVDGERVMITDRERDLLGALVDAGGAIRSKESLLHAVWADEADAHVVEVNVARLRQRLGPAADAIETVFRRGYRWSGTIAT